MNKIISILGSTGSIGRNTLDVIRSHPARFRVAGLAAGRNVVELARQIREFQPEMVSVQDPESRNHLLKHLETLGFTGRTPEILTGGTGAAAVATLPAVNMVVSAMVGVSGLVPTYRAILDGKQIALANKETLVAAGEIMIQAAARSHVRLLPVDSEHNAIFQCLNGEDPHSVKRIWLTASGGPFFRTDAAEFPAITPESALRHPTWRMGPKISIDSATMMNKGLEVIEAFWLFRVPVSAIHVVIHPQSVIHSMVEFVDGSILAQLGQTDMKLPIRFALNYPERAEVPNAALDLFQLRALEFFEPDFQKFPCLPLAYDALLAGGPFPAILSAANEVAVECFLKKIIPFTAISGVIRSTLDQSQPETVTGIEHLLEIDARARQMARASVGRHVST